MLARRPAGRPTVTRTAFPSPEKARNWHMSQIFLDVPLAMSKI